ncbi:kinetochore-associated protein NSL1 homolog [Electrophorus electricus]|uniref:NSL1 component of MIS12 kinetochore complex n=1 Tax=Electrophorus electricus TaxID=8005 RepID=A0A4W4HF95_ELEEL|nr:kinetochore-associated protein NSL1 homolog [Electrophorus electricus]
MEDFDRITALQANKDEGFKVNVKSKRVVVYQLAKYKHLFKNLLDGQSQLRDEDKNKLLGEVLTNFQLAVQENIVVDGFSWEEAPEEDGEDCELSALDDLLDEKIIQTTWKRSIYPKKILPYVVRCLKAERKLMDLFQNGMKPQEVKRDAVQDAIMNNVSVTAPKLFKQASTVMKSLKALQQTAEGLQQVLNTQFSAHTLEAYREVVGTTSSQACPSLCQGQTAHRHTIKRAVSETEYSMDYVPTPKAPATSAEHD